jgi:hypothetical protein
MRRAIGTFNFSATPIAGDSFPFATISSFAGKVMRRKNVIDHDHERRQSRVRLREFAPRKQRNAHRPEVIGTDDPNFLVEMLGRRKRTPDDREESIARTVLRARS